MTLTWSNIKSLEGGQAKGFEELCSQLARAEIPSGSTFIRKGTPDAGVECFAKLSDGTEWGWQSKYFLGGMGDPQWAQIDKSVITAIDKHPRLVQYYVCVPQDLPDARIKGQTSAREKWNQHVREWTKFAQKKSMNISFTYWGSHELWDRLSRPEHVGRLYFWFENKAFNQTWFSSKLDEALKTAGPRYTPEVNIDLPIALDFEAFGRTSQFFDRMKALARELSKQMSTYELSKVNNNAIPNKASKNFSDEVQKAITQLGKIKPLPAGELPFKSIADQITAAENAANSFEAILRKLEIEFDEKPKIVSKQESSSSAPNPSNPYREQRIQVFRVNSELQEVRASLTNADSIASKSLLILDGNAGTGKTHLLCDVVKSRIASGLPTVLLMGQRFISSEPPWQQALQHLDLPMLDAERFVGALESAAQSSGARALLVIDALNEGNGKTIWLNHLEAFLAILERSPWIGVVLSVRTSFEPVIFPASVRSRAASVTHYGFDSLGYQACRTFFAHYGLSFPSTPLLSPEFQNPLFLKTLCLGLRGNKSQSTLQSLQGITTVFDLYIESVNARIAKSSGFDARSRLVHEAMNTIASEMFASGNSWLSFDRAEKLTRSIFPDSDPSKSLYHNLVSEGVLIEDMRAHDNLNQTVVFISYERFADHLLAGLLLEKYACKEKLASAFKGQGPLAFVCDKKRYVSSGLLEALCIRIPEKTGLEFPSIAPKVLGRQSIGNAFRKSLVWRTRTSFTNQTRDILKKVSRTKYDYDDLLDVLLTVATLPDHPFNARFLDQKLRKMTMPNRDAFWSVYIHGSWGTQGTVDRLVEWTASSAATSKIDNETVDLCAITLSWLLTSSNRFLRDRATIALANLLTDRLEAVVRLIERFSEVDDPYVTERIYAVAYGSAMRSKDCPQIGVLAKAVYDRIFAGENPPVHILLRDYARGVVELALYRGHKIEVSANLMRPPYKSRWPKIPTESGIKKYKIDWSKGSPGSGRPEWSQHRIVNSVLEDDFARYVIQSRTTNWLALRLDKMAWQPPASAEKQLEDLFNELSKHEKKVLHDYMKGKSNLNAEYLDFSDALVNKKTLNSGKNEAKGNRNKELDDLLKESFTRRHLDRLKKILALKDLGFQARQPPRFDVGKIKRYILWRVFDLGWTINRFGSFDRDIVGYQGREAAKSERIGKKYQWIAFHEILAFLADHYQYREEFREEDGDRFYKGPWQTYLRDIDPSCTLSSVCGGTSWGGHSETWWCNARFDSWETPANPEDWVLKFDDLPKVPEMLIATNPLDGTRWLNGLGYFHWKQKPPTDQDSSNIEERGFYYNITGYLLRAEDSKSFLAWAETNNPTREYISKPSTEVRIFLGEWAWAPAFKYFQSEYYGNSGWTNLSRSCPYKVHNIALQYVKESTGFDCSIDSGFTISLPISDLIDGLGLRWNGQGANFENDKGKLVVQDPTVFEKGPDALLIREDFFRMYLAEQNLTICWLVTGEKRILPPLFKEHVRQYPILFMYGAYSLSNDGVSGFLKFITDIHSSKSKVLHTYRSPM